MNDAAATTRSRAIWFGLFLIIILAALLRLWRIDVLPPGFHFDESFEGLEAWRILTDPTYRPVFLTGNFGVPPLNAYANALSFWLFERFGPGAGPAAMRTTAAFFGVLGVATLFALADELRRLDPLRLTRIFPLLAAAVLAVMRWHIHFSRMGIEPIIVPVLWAGATWLFLRGWRTDSSLSYGSSGVLLAVSMYTYQAAWIIPFLMIPMVGVLWLGRSPSENSGRHLSGTLLTASVAFLLFLPLSFFFVDNPTLLLERPTQVVIVGETGSPADAGVWANIQATAKMFGPFGLPGDLDPRRNLPGEPALNLWLALPFYAGLLLALWRIRNPAYSITLIGLVGLLLPGIFSEYAPHFHRVLGASAPTALLAGLGLNELWRIGKTRADWLRGWSSVTAGALIALLLILGAARGAHDYFVRWAALPDLFYAFDVGFWELGQVVAALPEDETAFVTPRGSQHATLAFAWRDHLGTEIEPVAFDGRYVFPLTADAPDQAEHYAVIEHEDFRTRLLLPEVLPEATVTWGLADSQGQTYAQIYTRPAASPAARPPSVTREAVIGDGIRLAGYDAQPAQVRPGEPLYVQLHWLVDAAPEAEWTVFTHLVDSVTGEVVAGKDAPPGNDSLPTVRWQAGWRILDEYQIDLPMELPPGDYLLRAGLYDAEGAQLPPGGVELGTVTLAP